MSEYNVAENSDEQAERDNKVMNMSTMLENCDERV